MISEGALLGIRGFLIDAPTWDGVRSWSDGAILIDEGVIAEVGHYDQIVKRPRSQPVRWVHSRNVAVFPGLIDLHSHVPQYPGVARAHADLLPWLRQHVFPLERDFTSARARREAPWFFQELARHGTTTAMLYSGIYEDGCDAGFAAAQESGLRVIMGQVMMDVAAYGQFQPKKVASIAAHESERLCKKWHRANNGLLEYAFSPRFAVSCSEKLMRGAAEMAAQYDAYLQTHLAENAEEIEKVRHQFTWAEDYTSVYEKFGLLTPRTVLGHCIHISERESALLADRGVSVAHCPTANFFLGSGLMRLDQLRAAGVRVGLGSDVGAGPELNLWQVMRSAIEAQQARACYESGVAVPTAAQALHLATQGAAEALGKARVIGSFDVGKEADFVVVDYASLLPYRQNAKAPADLSAEDIVSLCIYRGGPHAVIETYVRGRSVYRAPEPELRF